MSISLLLGDDQPVVIEGLQSYFRDQEMNIVHVARTTDELVDWIVRPLVQVVITESRLGNQDTLGRLSDLSLERKLPPVIFFSGDGNLTPLARALAMSAYDYVGKHEPLDVLRDAIVGAATSKPVDESRPIRQRRVQMTATKGNFSKNSPLTRREIQVLRHVSMGLSNREIGMSLGISVETTKEHVQNILRKLDVNDRTQAAIWALRRELV